MSGGVADFFRGLPDRFANAARGTVNGMSQAGEHTLASIYSGVTLPRDVYRGDVDLGSDEAIGRTLDLAGVMAGGSVPAPVPAGAVRTFGGRAARTADHGALERAAEMQGGGASPDAIWRDTGWALGHDEIPRFEIPDHAARVRAHDGASATTLAQALDHPALFEAYPQLRDVQVLHRPELGLDAAAKPDKNWIALDLNGPDALPALLHEGQHFVQRFEGFAPGSSPRDPLATAAARDTSGSGLFDAYQRAAGEVEARNVERRQGMTPLERRVVPPEATEDTVRAQQWNPRSISSAYGAPR